MNRVMKTIYELACIFAPIPLIYIWVLIYQHGDQAPEWAFHAAVWTPQVYTPAWTIRRGLWGQFGSLDTFPCLAVFGMSGFIMFALEGSSVIEFVVFGALTAYLMVLPAIERRHRRLMKGHWLEWQEQKAKWDEEDRLRREQHAHE